MDEKAIGYVENYIQVDLLPLLEKIEEENEISIDKTMFFGNIYTSAPSLFKFSMGEKIQIKGIVSFVNKITDSEDGIHYFFKLKNRYQNFHTKTYPRIGRFFYNEIQKPDDVPMIDFNEAWKSDLCIDIMKSYEAFDVAIDINIENIISVNKKCNGKLIGTTKCVCCIQSKKKKN